jgi:hypothetical protein
MALDSRRMVVVSANAGIVRMTLADAVALRLERSANLTPTRRDPGQIARFRVGYARDDEHRFMTVIDPLDPPPSTPRPGAGSSTSRISSGACCATESQLEALQGRRTTVLSDEQALVLDAEEVSR